MKKTYHFGAYGFTQMYDDNNLFEETEEKTCTLKFASEKSKFLVNLNEDEMKRLVGDCVKAFGLKAVVNAVSEAIDDDE